MQVGGVLPGEPAEAIPGRFAQWLRCRLRRWRRWRRQRAAYRSWIAAHESRVAPAGGLPIVGKQATFSLVMPCVGWSRPDVIRAFAAVRGQSYCHWELCIAAEEPMLERLRRDCPDAAGDLDRIKMITVPRGSDPAVAANECLAASSGRFVVPLPAGGQLAPEALATFADIVRRRPDVRILYSDDDRIDWLGRRCDPAFKSQFNHVMLLTHDCMSHPVACDRGLAVAVGGWRPGCGAAVHHDFLLRAVGEIERLRIVHVPAVLLHRRATAAADAEAARAGRDAVAMHLARLGIAGAAEPAPEASCRHRVRLAIPTPAPLVSVVICTRDNPRMLARCIATLRDRTRYGAYEIVLVDNGSTNSEAIELIASLARLPDVVVVRDDSPFNFSRLNNAAVAGARGDFVCLLNDDTEVLTPEWLDEMVGFAMLDNVGAVGARLWYPDGTLQHGGVVLDPGVVATHAFARYPRGDTGYGQFAVIQREVSAVTAACLVVRREKYEAVGGLDERLAVAFNDVDFCLRLRAQGWSAVWTPYAELIHHESVSRGRDDQPDKRARFASESALMRDRWGDTLAHDPCYGPHFSSRWADCSIAPR